MTNAATIGLSAVALYAMVASCSGTMRAPDAVTSLAAHEGEWTVVEASAPALKGRTLRIDADAISVPMACAPSDMRATLDRRGRVTGAAEPAAAARPDAPAVRRPRVECATDRAVATLVKSQPDVVRLDARTLEIRKGRQRVRIRRA